MNTNHPQFFIQQCAEVCKRLQRSLHTIGEMLEVARPDSAIVSSSQIQLRKLAVELDNAAIRLNGSQLTDGCDE
ncbi:hypothetical protein SAMN06265784_102748 [Paraburkholderia susongensis]|uniref:Uncharacterized protein n=2 Tax=Paraburkholderia susongensis TaxID=1515439 RepID=A0A1X7JJK0_9BURK|nr:hypothetical protein SAMN06265784_102748 [Paraburkholderia susongensis]